jgi:hypothetical protein
MPDPAELLRAWEAAIREVGATASSFVSGSAELAGQLGAPLQRQAELLERVLQQQVEFERELAARLLAPARAVLDMTEQTTDAMRAQAAALRAAASSLTQVADLLDQQVTLVQQATQTVRDPIAALRSASGLGGA